jgi:hypothetical protein
VNRYSRPQNASPGEKAAANRAPPNIAEPVQAFAGTAKGFAEEIPTMGWLQQMRMRRAAKQYARRLGPHLRRTYGLSDNYTPGQIRNGIDKLRLDSTYVVLGYAAFLNEASFAALASDMPVVVPFEQGRALVERFSRSSFFAASGFLMAPGTAEAGLHFMDGGHSAHDGSGGAI